MRELEHRLNQTIENLLREFIARQQAPGPFRMALHHLQHAMRTELRCNFGDLHCVSVFDTETLRRMADRRGARGRREVAESMVFNFLAPLFRNLILNRRARAQEDLGRARQRERDIQQYTSYDIGAGDYTFVQVEITRAADDTILQERRTRILNQMNQQVDAAIENAIQNARAHEMPTTTFALDDRHAVQMWGRAVQQHFDGGFNRIRTADSLEPPAPGAFEKGWQLFLENLSPEQRRHFDKHNYFTVKGNHTGRTYAIGRGISFNICLMVEGSDLLVEACYCFQPKGDLCMGDVMLTQKIALETNEKAALEVANVSPGHGGNYLGLYISCR